MTTPCAPPPPIHGFRVVAAGERFARLQWGHKKPWRTYQPYHYEVDWWSRDSRTTFLPTRLVLQAPARTAILSNLDSKSNYSARITARSECGAAGIPNELSFATRSQEIHSAITRVMPHEVILITVVLVIWLAILYHFFKKYEKMTFVNPNRAFQEKKYEKTSDVHRESDVTSRSRKVSEQSKKSVCQFNLLEDVVTNWRTETLFHNKKIAQSDVASSVDHTDFASVSTDTHTDRKRRSSNYTVSDEPHWSHQHNKQKISSATVRPSNSLPLFQKPLTLDISPEKRFYTPIDEELTPQAPAGTPDRQEDDSESSLEIARKLAKISGNLRDTLEPEEPMKRKISEVLLGKATVDIRRCSTLSAYVRRPKATKFAMVRRQSLFDNLRRSIKRPFGRQNTANSTLVPDSHPVRRRYKGPMKFKVGESTSHSSSISDPMSRPDSLSLSQTSRSRPPLQYLRLSQVQNDSTESYFTATSSVVINIEPDEGEITPKAPNQN